MSKKDRLLRDDGSPSVPAFESAKSDKAQATQASWIEKLMSMPSLEKKHVNAFLEDMRNESEAKSNLRLDDNYHAAFVRVHIIEPFQNNPPAVTNEMLYRLKYISKMSAGAQDAAVLYDEMTTFYVLEKMNTKHNTTHLSIENISKDEKLYKEFRTLWDARNAKDEEMLGHSIKDAKQLNEIIELRENFGDAMGFFKAEQFSSLELEPELIGEEFENRIRVLNENNLGKCIYHFMQFGEFLQKKFVGYTPEEINNELKLYKAELSHNQTPDLTSFCAAQKACFELYYEENATAERTAVIESIQFGMDALLTLYGDKAKEALANKQVSSSLKNNVKGFISNDLAPNAALRHDLEKSIEAIKHYGDQKFHQRDGKKKGCAALDLARSLRQFSKDYFSAPFKKDELKSSFSNSCHEEIAKANQVMGRSQSALWKKITKATLVTIAVIATAGIGLIAHALYQSIKNASLEKAGMFAPKKSGQHINDLKRRVDAVAPGHAETIELTSKKPRI